MHSKKRTEIHRGDEGRHFPPESQLDWRYLRLIFVLLLALFFDDLFGIVKFTSQTTFFLTSGLYFRALLYWVVILSIYLLSLLMLKIKSKAISIPILLIFISSTILEVSFSTGNGVGLTKTFLRLLFIGQEFLLNGAATYFSWPLIGTGILVIVFYLLLFKMVRNERWFGKNFSSLPISLLIFLVIVVVDIGAYTFTVSKFEKYPANMRLIHTLIEIPLKNALTTPRAHKHVFIRNSTEEPVAENIVLVIDESIRAD